MTCFGLLLIFCSLPASLGDGPPTQVMASDGPTAAQELAPARDAPRDPFAPAPFQLRADPTPTPRAFVLRPEGVVLARAPAPLEPPSPELRDPFSPTGASGSRRDDSAPVPNDLRDPGLSPRRPL